MVIKKFPCSTQLSTKFILLINVEMSTIDGILSFISMINTISERHKARKFFICWYFSFYEQLKFFSSVELSTKKVLYPRDQCFVNLSQLEVKVYISNMPQAIAQTSLPIRAV